MYIDWIRWNEYSTSKKKLFPKLVSSVAVFKGYVEFVIDKYWKIFNVILTSLSLSWYCGYVS